MNKGPIIVGGCGSSGTTLFRKILNAHPNIAIGPEMSVFDRPKLYSMAYYEFLTDLILEGDFDSLDDECLIPLRINGEKTYCGLAPGNHGPRFYHPAAVVRDMAHDFESIGAFFEWYFGLYAQNKSALRWGEKTPNNVFCIPQVLEMFPNAVFINVVRDPRDVVYSLVNRRNADLTFGVWRWLLSVNAFGSALRDPTTDADRIYCVKYEDMVRDPEATLRDVCDFIGEDFSPRMLEYYKFDDEIEIGKEKEFDKSGTDYAVSPITDESVGNHKKADKIFVERVVAACLPQMTDFGYDADE